MQVTLEVPAEKIANLMISAIESGDPVTTAAKGGWCNGINILRGGDAHDLWYADPKTWDGDFLIEVIEVDDETTGHETTHKVDRAAMERGLKIMAQEFPHIFAQILEDNMDAPCADILLQCALFGDEKYA